MASRGNPDQDQMSEIRGKRGSALCDRGATRGRIETLRSILDGQNERENVGLRRGIRTHLTPAIVAVHPIFF